MGNTMFSFKQGVRLCDQRGSSGFRENESVIPKSFFNIIMYMTHMFQLSTCFFKVIPYGLSRKKIKTKKSF